MCIWDQPTLSTTRIRSAVERFSRGMYRDDRHQSPFCIKSQAPRAFERLFDSVQRLNAPLVLSYSPYAAESRARPRVMTVDEICSLARRFFPSVQPVSAGRLSHMKLNTSRLNVESSAEAELLIICKKH